MLFAGGSRLRPVPFTDVQFEDTFWRPRIETNLKVTLPHNLKMCEETGRISNFSKAAGRMEGAFEGIYFNDSDVYKVLEGAAYCLAQNRDAATEARIDKIIDEIAAAQQPDGYINTYYTLAEPGKRWTNLNVKHELYCAGHMIEAGVAYAQATGKTKLLDVCLRMADHIDGIFGPGKRIGWPGHQEIELALIKLYRHTGEERYAKLARFFLDVRGTTVLEKAKDPSYHQAHKPIREQTHIVGHAVRAMYMFAGVADVAALTGDEGYIRTMETIWDNTVNRKMYVTGGVGARHGGEAFGDDYELPNDTAYCETCAAIALALWNQRLAILHADGRYADVVERAIYNGILSGVSLKGDTFFYVNPLASNGKHHRQSWFGCACCPTNVVRFIPSIPGYVYTTDDGGIWIHQYVASTAKMTVGSTAVTLVQKTEYPWSGDVAVTVQPDRAAEFDVRVRIPGWCRGPSIKVAGEPLVNVEIAKGYVTLHRQWKPGDTIELSLPMPVDQVDAHPNVVADRGRVALQRGPIVYCVEAIDNGGRAFNLVLPRDAELGTEKRPDLLGGVMVVKARGLAVEPMDWSGKLYQPLPSATPTEITAVPYCVWDHREPGEMQVWIPATVGLAATRPAG
ncbi:MAG: glycoside hydrolase family 127 protein [Planctomycetes bacterium]|nr:glycoside hydrolase family 127 protein [Planctomycetota bacterium]